jgi:hypothetical protein
LIIVQFLTREVVVANKPWFATLMQPERIKNQKQIHTQTTITTLAPPVDIRTLGASVTFLKIHIIERMLSLQVAEGASCVLDEPCIYKKD